MVLLLLFPVTVHSNTRLKATSLYPSSYASLHPRSLHSALPLVPSFHEIPPPRTPQPTVTHHSRLMVSSSSSEELKLSIVAPSSLSLFHLHIFLPTWASCWSAGLCSASWLRSLPGDFHSGPPSSGRRSSPGRWPGRCLAAVAWSQPMRATAGPEGSGGKEDESMDVILNVGTISAKS